MNVDKNQGRYVYESSTHPEQTTVQQGFTDWNSLNWEYVYTQNLADSIPGVTNLEDLFSISNSKCKIKGFGLANHQGDNIVSIQTVNKKDQLVVKTK